MAKFEELLQELGERLHSEFYPSENNVVSLLIDKEVKMQLEADSHEEYLTIATFVAELPPGRFRESVLRDALKANFALSKLPGTFSYVGRENCLVLFEKLPLELFTCDTLVEKIKALSSRTKNWKEALSSGRSCAEEDISPTKTSTGGKLFGG